MTAAERTRVRRHPERQQADRAALHDVLDTATVAHLALARDDGPVVLPVLFARDGDRLLLHGSTGAGVLRSAAEGAPVSVAVTVVDGFVIAGSVFNLSANYRSAIVFGRCSVVPEQEKAAALRALTDRLVPGRWDEVGEPSAKELAATVVLALPLTEASVKVRRGDPGDEHRPGIWRGVLPIDTAVGEPVPAPGSAELPLPDSVRRTRARLMGRT